jgi:phytoene dehydrogenase-like protein
MKKEYDVIILGAGLGGLTAGCMLALKGKKVLIIEKHNKAGGYATSFTRGGFTFDVSLHNFGPLYENKYLNRIIQQLNILDKIQYIPFAEYGRIVFPYHDFVIQTGIEKYVKILKEYFPHEEEGIEEFFRVVKSIHDEFDEINELFQSFEKLEEKFPLLPVKFPYLVRMVYTTLAELLDEHIRDERLKGIIGNSWILAGLPPGRLAAILFSIITCKYYNFRGGLFDGTSQTLSDALSAQIESKGGEILLNSPVKSICFNNESLSGIMTERGDVFHAPVVISNINPKDTFLNLIPEGKIDKGFLRKVKKSELSVSALQLYLGLDCDPAGLGMMSHHVSVFSSYDQEKNFQLTLNGDYEKSFFCITNYTPFYSNLKGKGILCLFSLDHIENWQGLKKTDYKKKKKEVINIFLKRLERYVRDIGSHIVTKEMATPLTMKKFTNNSDGAIYGYSHITSQSGVNRLTNETPVKGLYLAGAYTYPGAGFSSVITSGYKAAELVLKSSGN